MTLTQEVKRAAAATAEDILQSDHESIPSREEEKEDVESSEIKKREKYIAKWILQPLKMPLRNKDEEDEDKEEDVGAPLASTEDGPPGDEDDEGHEDY